MESKYKLTTFDVLISDFLKFYNNKRVIKTASDTQVRKKIYKSSVGSWKNYEKYLGDVFKSLTI